MTVAAPTPTLPPLYFFINDDENQSNLPAEVLAHCLVGFADWGDLAKLACVCKRWSNILRDTAAHMNCTWELAQALLHGTNGLQRHPALAVTLLLEVTDVTVDEDSKKPLEIADGKTSCFAPAMKEIANCYLNGNGVVQNAQIGMAWLQASHDLGNDVDAAHELAMVHEYGRHGVDIDVVTAAKWLEKAANGGHVEAMAEYGLCLELGCCGVEQSDEQALEWYLRAANRGHVTAKFSVGEAYEEARGVPQSDAEACLWYYRAALEGDEDSKVALRRLRDIARIVLPGVGGILNA